MSAPELFNPDTVAPPVGPYSQAAWVKAGSDLLYIAGQVGLTPEGVLPADVDAQADQAFANIARILASAGLTPANLVKINTYLVTGQPVTAVRTARQKAFGDHKSASTLIFVPQLVERKYLIEVEAVAAR